MAQYRLAAAAKADIAAILSRSTQLHGQQARVRYRALLTAALRHAANNPEGPLSTDCTELASGVRSFHIRHSRKDSREARVANPVHVIFYRVVQREPIRILRILHERMDPRLHIAETAE